MRRLALLTLTLATACGTPDEPDPMRSSMVAQICQNQVREQLRSPSTAEFPRLMPLVEHEPGRRVATIEAHVDAQNAFGATVRNEFTCRVERKADDSGWDVTVNPR